MFTVDMLTSTWTCTAHSFIGLRRSIPTKRHDARISRADESRLSYLVGSEGHHQVPVCPWELFGDIDLQEAGMEVRKHATCQARHCLQYEGWTWHTRGGGRSVADKGFRANEHLNDTNDKEATSLYELTPFLDDNSEMSEEQSALATRSIFSWLRSDGFPQVEQTLWKHTWLQNLNIDKEEEQSDEELDDSSIKNKQPISVESWLRGSDSPQDENEREND
jgi:hypothetical protein